MNRRLSVYIIIGFILFTCIGTLTHELGHIAVAKYFDREVQLHYASMNHHNESFKQRIAHIRSENKEAILCDGHFKEKEEYEQLLAKAKVERIWITLGGPIQTMLFGTIGLWLLMIRKNKMIERMDGTEWFLVFLSLFWSRQIFNLIVAAASYFYSGKAPTGGDEFKLAIGLEWPLWSISIVLGLLGGLICGYIIFKIIPFSERRIFLTSAPIGSLLGLIIWFKLLGPIVLP